MSQAMQYQNHPSNPAAQPFNIGGKKCGSKTHSWWNVSSPAYFGNRKTKKSKNAYTEGEA